MHYRWLGFWYFLVLTLVVGCGGPELSKSDLGEVVSELPKVAGLMSRMKCPELEPPAKESEKSPEAKGYAPPVTRIAGP